MTGCAMLSNQGKAGIFMYAGKNDAVDISVIVPVFNHEKYVSRTLDSILSQETGFRYEIIAGDDCSGDRSGEIVQKYADKYSDVVVNAIRKENMGATNNIYDLIGRARGRYIAFCEGDDFWRDNGRIERDVGWLDKNPAYIGICGRVEPVDENGEVLDSEDIPVNETFWEYKGDCFTIEEFSRWQMPGHLSALTLRNFFRHGREDFRIIKEAHPVVADRTLVLLGVLRGRIKCSRRLVSCYRFRISRNGTNFMSEFKKKNMRYEDYHMMRLLEEYAWGNFGQRMDLGLVKADRFIGSVLVWMNGRNPGNWDVVWRIASDSGHKMRCMYYIGSIVIKKKIMQMTGNDRRIDNRRYRV